MKVKDDSWQLRSWQVPCLNNLELMHVAGITYDYPRHIHEEYSFVTVLQGVETHICRGTSYKAFPGDLMLLNADEAHANRSIETEYRVIHIHPKTLSRIGAEVSGHAFDNPYFFDPIIKDPVLFRVLRNLHVMLVQDDSPLEQESRFMSAVGLLLARQNKIQSANQRIGKEPVRIKLVLEYLKHHYAESISLTQLASLANLSPFYFLRVFSNQVGIPPHEYQIQLRVIYAKKLIKDGQSISQAALEAGFFDQSHFTRNFRRIVGITPSRYFSQLI